MPSLNAVITADATQFEREIARMQRIAGLAGGRIGSAMSGGNGGHGGGRGSMMESIVVAREILEGRGIARIIGSITLLGQRLGWLNLLFKVHKTALDEAAEASEAAAISAGHQALALTRKAAASSAAFMADQAGTEATLEQAAADDIAATAARSNAVALQQKAVAAAEAAAAQEAEASITAGVGGIIVGILIGIAAGAFAAYKQTTALIDKLSGVKPPDFEPKYIAEHLQKANQVAEVWKEIARAVDKATDSYASAANAAGRVASATKDGFDFQRKLLNIKRETELGMTADPFQKNAINKKYDDQDIQLKADERDAQVRNKIAEQNALTAEGNAKAAEAGAGLSSMPSKERDENNIESAKAKLDAARKAATDIDQSKMEGTFGVNGRDIFRAYNKATDSGVSTSDLNEAEKAVKDSVKTFEDAYKSQVNQAAANAEKRKPYEEKADQAADDMAKAATIGKEVFDDIKKNGIEHSQDVALAQAESYKRMSEIKLAKPELTANQKIGAYAFREGQTLLDVSRKQLDALYKIIGGVDKLGANHGPEEY